MSLRAFDFSDTVTLTQQANAGLAVATYICASLCAMAQSHVQLHRLLVY